MPRPRRIPLRSAASRTRFDPDLGEVLCVGGSALGGPADYGLRTLADWREAWGRWGAVLQAEHAGRWPGTRPLACYVLGAIPAATATADADLPWGWGAVRVLDDDGRLRIVSPRQWQRVGCEARHLRHLGLVDASELSRHRRHSVHVWRCLGDSCGC